MSDSEDDDFCFYGKPLEQYDEDSIPKRKPIPVEEQVATDGHGRRRFHGAFTGGFSAGFFNTVGSLEGWKPSEFKSSRMEKAEKKAMKPEDFMDDEDMGEHGIAPQMVRATKDYATGGKRKKPIFSEGPIPGIPVLHSLIEAGNETIGYLLMKNMDLKNMSKQDVVDDEGPKVYGCEMPKTYEIQRTIEMDEIVPEIFQKYIKNPKSNTFGLEYSGLDKSELNLKKSTQLVVRDQNNRKLAISGQAFGVGAFENDDDDIYAKDDMSQYDFEMTKEKSQGTIARNFNHPEFVKATDKLMNQKRYPLPTIPQSFSGKHKVRKSRFEPIASEQPKKMEEIKRKDMNAAIRAKYLGEEQPSTSGSSSSRDFISSENIKNKEFVSSANSKESLKIEKISSTPTALNTSRTSSTPTTLNTSNISSIPTTLNTSRTSSTPITLNTSSIPTTLNTSNMSTSGLIFDKFVVASIEENPHDILQKVEPTYTEHGTKEMRDAAKLKLFGPMTRIVEEWQPCTLLCKRFNVREPTFDLNKKDKRKKNQIFFEYEKHKEEGIGFKPGLVKTKEEEIGVVEEPPVKNEPVPEIEIVPENNHLQEKIVDSDKNEESDIIPLGIPEFKLIEETDRIDVAKNIDLFKAIFDSSSDSDSEDESPKPSQSETFLNESEDRETLMKKTVLMDDLLTNIKPKKEGILSNINFDSRPLEPPKPIEPIEPDKMVISDEKAEEKELDVYGPRLPAVINKSTVNYKCETKVKEKWVEKEKIKDKSKSKDDKDKKKHKKKKKKHKKSKYDD